ncbi:MAG: sigma-70 family RNA polymerase sigma factor [Archangium sp.]|nr:sigma-70 family RNA polymerase sigma factor [Archangium sp.]
MNSARSSSGEDARRSFERLYVAHRADVVRWGLRYGAGRSAWAEDLAHDVFLRLHGHLQTLDRVEDLAPWLYRTTANCALNRLRNERSWTGALARLFRSEQDEAPSPETKFAGRESVLKALRALPPKERMVLCMKVLDGKSQQEIADALELSEGYVSKLTARAWELIEEVRDEA